MDRARPRRWTELDHPRWIEPGRRGGQSSALRGGQSSALRGGQSSTLRGGQSSALWGGQSSALRGGQNLASGVDRAWLLGWTEPGLRGGQSLASGVDRTRPPTNTMVSEFAPCSFLFFCQLSVNEAGGFSADADVHLNSEVYGKRVGARCQEPRRCGPCNAALSPGPRPSARGHVHHPQRVLGRRAFSRSACDGFSHVVLLFVPC